MDSIDNATKFLNAYSRIERKLAELIGDSRYVPFSQMIYRCAKTNRIVANYQQTLREYSELRNAIVHQRGPNMTVIAQPTDEVTSQIEHIALLLYQDESIMQYASTPVQCLKKTDSIHDAFERMHRLHTTKLPVYDHHIFQGLVTLEEIAWWGLQKEKSGSTVETIMTVSKNEKVEFFSKKESIQTAVNAFEQSLTQGKTLLAILISENGKSDEKPLGIITVADLPNIMNQFV